MTGFGLAGLILNGLLVALAAVVEIKRPWDEGLSAFTWAVAILTGVIIVTLFIGQERLTGLAP